MHLNLHDHNVILFKSFRPEGVLFMKTNKKTSKRNL